MLYWGTVLKNHHIFRMLCFSFIWNEVLTVQCQSPAQNQALSTDEQNVADQCFTAIQCNASAIYRSMDGKCNNLDKPWWGATDTPYVRLMKPAYNDTNNKYRVSVQGSELPNPRFVSSTILKTNISKPDPNRTRMFLVFAQLIAHDVLQNPQNTGDGSKCCSSSGDSVVSTEGTCRPIPIFDNDTFYSQFGRKCQEYHKSVALNCTKLPQGTLLPLGRTTHHLDCSFLYGNTDEETKNLRSGQLGQLRIEIANDNDKGYLPTQNVSQCPFARNVCYKSGDVRMNQNLDLAVMETVFMRFHNRLATAISIAVPSLSSDDEKLYQETRRIVIACFQHIVYNEFLPLFLDLNEVSNPEAKQLLPLTSGYATGYNPFCNPSSLVDFAGAAFRTLHSQIPDFISVSAASNSAPDRIPYSFTLERSGDWLQNGSNSLDSDLHDLMSAHQEKLDIYYTDQITNHLVDFQLPTFNGEVKFGDDLAAMDIQRGRDYGLPSYNEYRKAFGFPPYENFDSFVADLGVPEIANTLGELYKSIEDIDVYVAILIEMSSPNVKTSSILQRIWTEAFKRYRDGDRFFYEFGGQPGSLSLDQLQLIRQFTLAHVVCLGGDSIKDIQTYLMLSPSDPASNPMTTCDALLANILSNISKLV